MKTEALVIWIELAGKNNHCCKSLFYCPTLGSNSPNLPPSPLPPAPHTQVSCLRQFCQIKTLNMVDNRIDYDSMKG